MKNNPNPEDLISVFVQDIVSKLEPIPAYNSQDDLDVLHQALTDIIQTTDLIEV